jgi:hypothetical protein
MAHDRVPPAGYLDCFQTNMAAPISKVIVAQRATDLDSRVRLCESTDWSEPGWTPEPYGFGLTPAAGRVLDNVWMPDPIFAYYVPPGQTPVQAVAALRQAFASDYHDTGCLVYPAEGEADGYAFAFLPANLRYAPEALKAIFPWASLVDFARTREPRPYNSAYALPAGSSSPPAPGVTHGVEWEPARLIGFTQLSGSPAPGGELEIELHFQTNLATPSEQWFQLSLVDGARSDAILASDQADPCRGMYPAWLWVAGQVIVAKSILYLPPDLPAGEYAVQVNMFDLAAGPAEMLAAVGDTTLVTLTITAP